MGNFYQVNKPLVVWVYQWQKHRNDHKVGTPLWEDVAYCNSRSDARKWKNHFANTNVGRVVKRTAPVYLEETNV